MLGVCAALGVTAAPALGFNSGVPPGPPFASGGGITVVFHCKVIDGSNGVSVVDIPSGTTFGGNGDCSLF